VSKFNFSSKSKFVYCVWDIDNATKNVYIERNKEIIDNSDVCLFYYDPKYRPPVRKHFKQSTTSYQPQSGTKIAFDYAIKKNKKIYNVFELLNRID